MHTIRYSTTRHVYFNHNIARLWKSLPLIGSYHPVRLFPLSRKKLITYIWSRFISYFEPDTLHLAIIIYVPVIDVFHHEFPLVICSVTFSSLSFSFPLSFSLSPASFGCVSHAHKPQLITPPLITTACISLATWLAQAHATWPAGWLGKLKKASHCIRVNRVYHLDTTSELSRQLKHGLALHVPSAASSSTSPSPRHPAQHAFSLSKGVLPTGAEPGRRRWHWPRGPGLSHPVHQGRTTWSRYMHGSSV